MLLEFNIVSGAKISTLRDNHFVDDAKQNTISINFFVVNLSFGMDSLTVFLFQSVVRRWLLLLATGALILWHSCFLLVTNKCSQDVCALLACDLQSWHTRSQQLENYFS